jgi:hypothetical protein
MTQIYKWWEDDHIIECPEVYKEKWCKFISDGKDANIGDRQDFTYTASKASFFISSVDFPRIMFQNSDKLGT